MLSECGQIFQGQFAQGVKTGSGWVKTTDGIEVFAKWKKSLLNGEGIIKHEDKKITINWVDNHLVDSKVQQQY